MIMNIKHHTELFCFSADSARTHTESALIDGKMLEPSCISKPWCHRGRSRTASTSKKELKLKTNKLRL